MDFMIILCFLKICVGQHICM